MRLFSTFRWIGTKFVIDNAFEGEGHKQNG